MDYQLSTQDGKENLVLFFSDGTVRNVPTNHINYDEIIEELFQSGPDAAEETLRELSDNPVVNVTKQLTRVSDRITIENDQVYFDGTAIKNVLSHHLLRVVRSGEDASPVALFMEKLATNLSTSARQNLWKWIEALGEDGLTLTDDGDILGYKGVQDTEDNLSVSRGEETVYVNDEPHTGHIPNPVGAVVWMDRSLVDPERSNACSVGLHVGTFEYAKNFGNGKWLLVKVNPRDVVEVPRDSSNQKMRVCRYEVISEEGGIKVETPTYYVAPKPDPRDDQPFVDDDEFELPDWSEDRGY
jgi:hypothetical protein